MSIIQAQDLIFYQLRTNYLNSVKDGVGERLITINDSFLNTPGFKAAGWRSNPAYIKRTHSPPIPTEVASEYFQAPPKSAAFTVGLDDEIEEGGLVTREGGNTVGLGLATKRRRRREQMEEDDSSDLSDDSDDDGDQRAAMQIKFAKMPIRTRAGSSPIRGTTGDASMLSPSKRAAGQRRGSQSAVEQIKARARRDTVTSSEMSSEAELDNRRQPGGAEGRGEGSGLQRQDSDLLEDEEEDSDASDISSAFAESLDSASILDSVRGIKPSPTSPVIGTLPRQLRRGSPKKTKAAPAMLSALPPPRPISMVQPKSLLSAAINARRKQAAMPFENFASLSGKGEGSPLVMRIWAPFTSSPAKYFEVLLRRTVHDGEHGDRPVTVAELIGLSLWRYSEEKLEPSIATEKLNVNWWTLRMVEDDEVDYDFPALERTKPVVSFTTVNNRAARSRSNSRLFDEFALVEASNDEFKANQRATPQYQQESAPKNPLPANPAAISNEPRQNPLLETMPAFRQNGAAPADMPAAPTNQTITRTGVKKVLKVHIHSTDAAPGQMMALDVTTDTYLAEVLDMVCKKRQLDKANHVLKLPGSGTVVLLDRTVESIGNCSELDLFRRRFATDGPLSLTGSPGSTSPKPPALADPSGRKIRKAPYGTHPLAQGIVKQDEVGSANYRKYIVWRKQPMRFVGLNERVLAIDGEYLHFMPSTAGKTVFDGPGKTTTVHFSNVVGCKVTRRHPTNFKVVVFKNNEQKRYDYEAKNADEAAEIVYEIKKGIAPYHDI